MSNDVKKNNVAPDTDIGDTGQLKELLKELFPSGVSPDMFEDLPEEIQSETEAILFENDSGESFYDVEPDAANDEPAEAEEPQNAALEDEMPTEAEVADAIAQAVESAFMQDEITVIPAELPEPEPEHMISDSVDEAPVSEEEPSSDVTEPQKDARELRRERKRRRDSRANRKTKQKKESAKPEKSEQEVNEVAPAPAAVKTAASRPKKQASAHPGTDYVKISRTHVSVSMKERFTTMFSGVLERQKEALPPVGVNLKQQEKSVSAKTGLDRMLNPLRYVILVLMFLCLAGRKYEWMTLGFMKGIGGTYVSLILTIAIMLICWQSTIRSIRDMLYMQFSYESYLLIATLLTMFEALVNKNAETLLPLLTMSWCVCGIANLMNSQADLRSLRAVITDRNRVGIREARAKWEGKELIGKAASGTNGFVRRQAQMDPWHFGNTWFTLPLMVVCVVVAAYLSAKTESDYFTVLVSLMDIGIPVSMALCCARPYTLLSQVLTGKGVVAGWGGMKGLSGKKAVMIYDNDLFPKGTLGHKGVKVYGRFTASQLVSYGASMVIRADIGLTDVFTRLLRDADGQLLEVRHLQIQESGIEGRIHGGRVQVGTYHFMQLMGVAVPQKGSTNGVYIAVNGQLAGMFAIKYSLRSGSISAFRRFTRDRLLAPLVVTRNFTVNPAFIQKSFKASINQLSCPKTETRRMLSDPGLLKGGATYGFVLRDGVNAYSRTVGGARRVYRMGMIYTLLSIALTLYLTFDTIIAISTGRAMIEITRVLLMHFWLFLAVEVGARVAIRK